MATTTSIFFTPGDPLEDCCKTIETILGCSFHLEKDDGLCRYVSYCLGLELVLFGDHGIINDANIPFESYSHDLDLSVGRNGIDPTIADSYQQAASKYIFELFKDRLNWRMALVHNLQHLLATFP